MADMKHSGTAFNTKRSRKRNRVRQPFSSPFKKRRIGKAPSATASKALGLVRSLLRNREVKRHALGFTNNSVGTGGTIYGLSDVSQGDTALLRDGNSMSVFKLDVRWAMIKHASDSASFVRIIIFHDRRQRAGIAPVVLDVLAEANPLAQFKFDNRTRWNIYLDVTGEVHTNAPSVFGHYSRTINVKVDFTGAASTNILHNGFYVLVITDEATNLPLFQRTSEIRFNDY